MVEVKAGLCDGAGQDQEQDERVEEVGPHHALEDGRGKALRLVLVENHQLPHRAVTLYHLKQGGKRG